MSITYSAVFNHAKQTIYIVSGFMTIGGSRKDGYQLSFEFFHHFSIFVNLSSSCTLNCSSLIFVGEDVSGSEEVDRVF